MHAINHPYSIFLPTDKWLEQCWYHTTDLAINISSDEKCYSEDIYILGVHNCQGTERGQREGKVDASTVLHQTTIKEKELVSSGVHLPSFRHGSDWYWVGKQFSTVLTNTARGPTQYHFLSPWDRKQAPKYVTWMKFQLKWSTFEVVGE